MPEPAAAGCSAPAATVDCTGNVSGGANFGSPVTTLNVNSLTANIAPPSGTHGISLTDKGDKGSNGKDGAVGIGATSGHGGDDGKNLTITYTQPGADPNVATSGAVVTGNAAAIFATSTGGNGGNGGDNFVGGSGKDGGDGGSGGAVTIYATGATSTSGDGAAGIVAVSIGGNGGDGGGAKVSVGGSPGDGGKGGHAGTVTVDASGTITTHGKDSNGIHAVSRGGAGGNTGNCSALFCGSGSAGNAAFGGTVNVTTAAGTAIETFGTFSNGIYAASIGGFAGSGGSSAGVVAFGSSGASAGDGGHVTVTNGGSITTHAANSYGIFAQSVGGGGGGGGSSGGLVALGGSGSSGGSGGKVDVTNSGAIATSGDTSIGILAQSVGGSGGDGGNSGGLVSIGGNGSATTPGGDVTVTNTGAVTTAGNTAQAILAQSIGGGGGNGGTSGGVFSVGGSGGGGGDGGKVQVSNSGTLQTGGSDAVALFAQSVGGGGGNGGGAYAFGAGISFAMGGSGGDGGNGGVVTINPTADVNTLTAANIVTTGDRSHGIQAQSIGGGGGNGGLAVAGSISSSGFSAAVALGGSGGGGGAADAVTVNEKGTISTGGDNSYGIFAQSVGGGGGNGGGSVSVSAASAGYSLGFAMGGTGGSGGNGKSVTVNAVGNITTTGTLSHGLMAQSVGGGGGNGGFAVTATAGAMSGSVALGGSGGVGGNGSSVTVDTSGAGFVNPTISTSGTGAVGVFAQSVGGGGGNGGFAGSLGVGGGAISVALGGRGGAGGTGGSVSVTNADAITTAGANSVGILAQSVGGGGGNGGFALSGSGGVISVAAAVGGSGGAGSNGGTVMVDNSGNITTAGGLAYGILAQSAGGGGGNGGFAISGSVGVAVEDIPGGSAAISIGGKGGGASNGGAVTLTNGGSIETSGAGAHAILAQSVGGGGGSGGFAGSLAMTIGNGAAFGVAVGGSGGGGGNGGGVGVTSTGASIVTHSDGANGIFAQSLGGGGGDGGFAFSGAFGFGGEANVNVAVAIGGHGGNGGTGSTVQVTNQTAITTHGVESNGIFAQSIGGGGGNGGFAVSGTLGLSETSGNVGVSVGGFAGNGSTAGNVTITNSGAITTTGNNSIGIFGQSIGGSGGNGGMAMTAQLTGATKNSATIGVAVGGGGGDGNSAGTVDITNNVGGAINTSGFGAHGIEGQSIGGGGGNGGMAVVAQVGVALGSEKQATKTLNVGVAIGGAGGNGGAGNSVHVTNHDAINVGGDTAIGIFAQSIGGGGGDGGGALNALGMVTDSTNKSSRSVAVDVSIGGKGGNGNHGGAVTVDNAGSIATHGVSGYGVYAQSTGGGGGIGGRANTMALLVTDACTLPLLCTTPASVSNNWQFGVTVGGNGGGASNGGAVTVNNTGQIETFGDSSDGIFAQSVGGGGGNGGNGTLGSGGILPVPVEMAFLPIGSVNIYQNLQVEVGGNSGSSGNGGTVSVDNDKNITTHAANSNGIFAQSIGGGGGIGGNAVIGATGVLGVGGKGGAAGNGGDVTVTQHGGATIETFGVASDGIFAQSVGGGGGVAGNVDRALAGSLNLGIGVALGQGGGGGGDGGHVSVSADGMIITHGDSAAGIYAQSVGGGGGELGELGNDLPVLSLLSWHIGSNGDAGNAGAVDVTLTGAIKTSGNNATGIFAQSAGGTGTAGNVNVTLNSSILTGSILGAEDGTANAPLRGLGSIGILAQSVAVDNAKNGDITINLNDANGVVQGGRSLVLDAARAYVGVGIWVEDGKNNTITNHGLVTTLGGVNDGYAILATGSDADHPGGNETVANFGTVTGSVDLGAGTNSFINETSAFFNSGHIASIGAGNLLTNNGTLSPGALGNVFTTAVTGNFIQSAGGTYALDLDFLPNTADRIDVSGTSAVSGTVAVNRLNTGNVLPGSHQITVLTSAGGVTDHSGLALNVPSSAVATYGLVYPDANSIALGYDINFFPQGLPPQFNSIGNAINAIQTSRAYPGFVPIAAALFDIPDIPGLINAYNALGGEGTVAAQQAALATGGLFSSMLTDQAQLWLNGGGGGGGAIGFAEEDDQALGFAKKKRLKHPAFRNIRAQALTFEERGRWRAWASGFGGHQTIDSNAASGTAGVSQGMFGGALGFERRFGADFVVGLGAGASSASYTVADRQTNGVADGGHVGIYAGWRSGPLYLIGNVAYAHFDNRTDRIISGVGPTENATGKFASDQFALRAELGWRERFDRFTVTPFAALQFAQLRQAAYSESSTTGTGPGILGLSVQSQRTNSLPLSVGAQVETQVVGSRGSVWSPFVRAAWVHEFDQTRSITAAFNVAPGVLFTTAGAQPARDAAQVSAGTKVAVAQNMSLYGAFTGEFSGAGETYSGTGGFKFAW